MSGRRSGEMPTTASSGSVTTRIAVRTTKARSPAEPHERLQTARTFAAMKRGVLLVIASLALGACNAPASSSPTPTVTPSAIAAATAPGSNGPWRLWFGAKVLAINESSGEVYYFDPSATDGPQPPGPARRDPTEALRLLLGSFGWSADVSANPDGPTRFMGTEVTARADPVISTSWLEPGYRETAVLFPRYQDSTRQPGPHVYGADHMALLTAKSRPAEIIHRPVGAMSGREIYPITTFGQARGEVLASPVRYLPFLSDPTGAALQLTL